MAGLTRINAQLRLCFTEKGQISNIGRGHLAGHLGTAARQAAGSHINLRLAFAGGTILLAWLFVHTSFAIHYAHEFYRDAKSNRPEKSGGEETQGSQTPGGLIFPEEDCPDYWDFLYFSFVLGATCQVSDVQVTSRVLRRLVLAHGVLAFVFNTLILALAINIAASAF